MPVEASLGSGSPAPVSSKQAGSYALLLYLARQTEIEVGKLGRFCFPGGYYLYFGSAMGGLKGRLARYLRAPTILHWHIDYLRHQSDLLELWWQQGQDRRECTWAATSLKVAGARLPVPRFGSSDCRCPGHLVHFMACPDVDLLGDMGVSKLRVAGGSLGA